MLKAAAKSLFSRILGRFGLKIIAAGCGYISAEHTIAAARKEGKSICDYLEGREPDQRKVGRRDRIVERILTQFFPPNADRLLEIGSGTGMYLEALLAAAKPSGYEVYETDVGWRKYLKEEFGQNPAVVVHPADGETLRFTSDNGIDFVHVHAVFVYTPILITLNYLREIARVCRLNGVVVFDCFLDTTFGLPSACKWLASDYRFPVLLPERLLIDFCTENGLVLENRFREIYGVSEVDYLVFRKALGAAKIP